MVELLLAICGCIDELHSEKFDRLTLVAPLSYRCVKMYPFYIIWIHLIILICQTNALKEVPIKP